MKRLFQIASIVIVVAGSAITAATQDSLPRLSKADDAAYRRLVWITGDVRYLNHPELGITPANGQVLTFQSAQHPEMVVATRANLDGRFELFLSPGTYRLIVPELDHDRTGFVDIIPESQSRELQVRPSPSGIIYDIDLVIPIFPD